MFTSTGKVQNYGYDAFWTRFARRVRERREERGMSQRQVADAIGYSYSSVCNIEAGKHRPDLFMACAMAVALETDLNQLVGLANIYEPERRRAGGAAVGKRS